MRNKNSCWKQALPIIATVLLAFAGLTRAGDTGDYVRSPSLSPSHAPDEAQHWAAAIDAAQIEVAAARTRREAAPLALARALTALGNAQLGSGDYESGRAAYSEALQLTQQQLGENDARTLEPLRGMGFALAQSGQHDAAIPYLERSLHMTQARFGLFDLRQQDVLLQLAFSLTGTWRVADAENYMYYRLRVTEKTYGEGDPRMLPVFCDTGDWLLDIAKFDEARSAFQMALNITQQRREERSPAAVAPLRGLANTYMREQTYRALAVALKGPPYHTEFDARGAAVRPPGPRSLNPYGEHALLRALQILDESGAPEATADETLIDTLVQLGDWYQIKQEPSRALPYYRRASELMATGPSGAGPGFGFPVRVYYPAPLIVFQNLTLPEERVELRRVHMEFTVTAEGSVADARLLDYDTRKQYAEDILETLRVARFRPRLVDGQPVATSGMEYTEVLRTPPQKLTSKNRRSANP